MFTQKSREGWVFVDHRASPGMSEADARLNGYDPNQVKEGKLFEAASLTCAHCNIAVLKNPQRLRERAFCSKCHHYICDLCEAKTREPFYEHAPFVKLVDDHLAGKSIPQLGSPPKLLLP